VAELSYEEESSPAYGEQAAQTWTYAYVPASQPDHIDFSGPCPKCVHASAYHWPLSLVREDFLALQETTKLVQLEDAPAPQSESVLVRCQCSVSHPGNSGEKGCGRYWTLLVAGQ
jgi:hypothetical protein